MQVVELAGVIVALSIEVLVGIILAQLLKATSGEKTTRLSSHGFVTARKLYHLVGPTHSRVSTPAKKPRDEDKKAEDQRPTDAESKRSKSRRSKRSSLQSKLEDLKSRD